MFLRKGYIENKKKSKSNCLEDNVTYVSFLMYLLVSMRLSGDPQGSLKCVILATEIYRDGLDSVLYSTVLASLV